MQQTTCYPCGLLRRPFLCVAHQVGATIRKESLAGAAPERPKSGWSIVVRPAGRGVDYEPFVATPGGPRRSLSPDEALYLQRMKPRPRRKFV